MTGFKTTVSFVDNLLDRRYIQSTIISTQYRFNYLHSKCWIHKLGHICNLISIFVMPPPLGAGGIMFSGCPSVRPKPEIPSFDLYMGRLVHPTNRNRFTTCPSVRLSVRPSVCPSVRPSGEVSGHLPENAWRDWPEILHADVSWPSSELISSRSWSVDFSNFGTILT